LSVGDDTNSPRRPRVVLGVSGGIACYKACTVARDLTEAGASVDVALTASATEFIRPLTFETLTGRRVLSSLWEPGSSLDHIRWPRESNLIILAPATANILARAAQGLADDFLTTLLLASIGPVLVAPAMNDDMWANRATQENIHILKERGWHFIGPAVGPLAEGPSARPGRMVEPDQIVAEALRLIRMEDSPWRHRKVLVTAGATRESIDPIRIITNRSSGRMGYALAEAAYARGADVTLVAGPNSLRAPWGVEVIHVEDTNQMLRAVDQRLPETDVILMAAAPADYRPRETMSQKLPRDGETLSLSLEPTPDILATTRGRRKRGAVIVGFALETENGTRRAREKLDLKGLDLIALNVANEAHAPFESEMNQVTIVSKERTTEIPLLSKREVGEHILDAVEALF